jgi:hypothetical protein
VNVSVTLPVAVNGPATLTVELSVNVPPMFCVGSIATSAQSVKWLVETVISFAAPFRRTNGTVTQYPEGSW